MVSYNFLNSARMCNEWVKKVIPHPSFPTPPSFLTDTAILHFPNWLPLLLGHGTGVTENYLSLFWVSLSVDTLQLSGFVNAIGLQQSIKEWACARKEGLCVPRHSIESEVSTEVRCFLERIWE